MGVHPDNTAWRAVDACGGIYTPAEEASGFAAGHRAALASAMVAVGHADGITAALLAALRLVRASSEWSCMEVPAQDAVEAAIVRATQSPATEGGEG